MEDNFTKMFKKKKIISGREKAMNVQQVRYRANDKKLSIGDQNHNLNSLVTLYYFWDRRFVH